MFCFTLYLAAVSLLTGTAAIKQTFTNSGEMNIATCPITYYGQTYEKVYVAFNASRFAVCFNGLYKPGIKNDCILMSGGTADRGDLSVLTKQIPTGSGVHKLLPNLKNAGECVNVIPLKDSQESEIEQIELGNFGSQAILAIKTYSGYTNVDVVADAQVDGQTVSKLKFQTNETSKGVITDMSGCRLSGVVYKTNTTVKDPNICSTVTCDVTGVATAVSYCSRNERCQGDGRCALHTTCTMTGSTVIDFIGRVHFVPDRCAYNLMKSSSIPDFQVLGVFQERRRKDMSFLDHVILQLDGPGVQISLGQGGRVQLNNKLLALSATPAVFHGVELFKDRTGVTAKMSASKYTVSVVFDGTTAQIHMTGSSEAPMQGLCGNSNRTVSEEGVSKYSASGCKTQHDDTADSTINCNATTKWCNLLKQTPFTACNMHIDPKPFITACTQTLCKYPAVDGLKCQFLEAYARACYHRSKVTVKDWRSKSRCSDVTRACQDKFCSAHEFCGEKTRSRETRCVCRAIFASKYRSTSSFGDPTVCKHKSASLTLAGCLLEDKGIDYSVLHLNDESCKGEMNNLTHMVTFNFNSRNTCGTVIVANDSQVIYKNTIMTRNSSMYGLIERHNKAHIDFTCSYIQPDIKSLGIKIKQSSLSQKIASGQWIYNLTMTVYTDPDSKDPIQSGTEIQLDQTIWVELKTDGLDEQIVAVTDSCWATDQPSPSGSLRYDLIIKGCPNPADQTVKVKDNGVGTSNCFSYSTFRFSGQSDNIYLHCRVKLCVTQGNACVPNCSHGARRRRSQPSKYEDENPGLITMAWTA